jgi:hypothetical protein
MEHMAVMIDDTEAVGLRAGSINAGKRESKEAVAR